MLHILVPIGSTDSAKNSLQYAVDFAASTESKVFVFRAYSAPTKAGTIINIDSIIERETNLYLKTLVASIDRKNVDISLVAAKGGTVDSVNALEKELGIDLIIVGAKTNSIKEEVYLGKTAGSLVKQTNIPVLAVPDHYEFSPIKSMLMGFKSGKIENPKKLTMLEFFAKTFQPNINMLLVKTPGHHEEDLILDPKLDALKSSLTITENATTFQGVLEHFQTNSPDMLCVFRRKRGFFQKLWEKNTILKSEFHTTLPLLILKGE